MQSQHPLGEQESQEGQRLVERQTSENPDRNTESEDQHAEGKRPGAPSGAPRSLQEEEGGIQRGDQGGENPVTAEDPVSGKHAGSLGVCLQVDCQQEEGEATPRTTIQDSEGNWAGNRTETAMALIRKYFPEDHPGSDTPENRETRASRVEWSEDKVNKIRATDVSQLLYFLLCVVQVPTTMSTQVR
jgi:hypothetical protein